MRAAGTNLAQGVAEAQRINEGFATPEAAAAFWAEGTENPGETEHVYPGGDGAARAARRYPGQTSGAQTGGTVLYIHGGGWVGGSIALNHRACRLLAAHSGWDIVSISYRLAPQHPFPAALEDCVTAFDWLRNHSGGGRVVLAGASAGGNLALALALRLTAGQAAGGTDTLAGLLLFYPVTGADFSTQSYHDFAQGYGLSRTRMQELFDHYDPGHRRGTDPMVTPLAAAPAQLAPLPPCCFVSAECDVLADDTRRMAERLTQAGLTVDSHIEPGVTHGFINRGRLIPAADACLTRAARYLKALP